MPRRSWYSLVGSAGLTTALAVTLAVGSAAQAVGPPVVDAPAPQLADLPSCGPAVGPGVGPEASWAVIADLDQAGTLVGWTLRVDAAGAPPLRIQLPPESSMSRAGGGRAVVTADDGTRSTVAVISVAGRCATTVARLDSVARSAVLRGRDGVVLVHAVDRVSRQDLGVWVVRTAGAVPERILAALGDHDPAVRAVGRVFATALRLDPAGDRVAVQSCGARTCRTRVVELATLRSWRVEAPEQGPLVAFDRARLTFQMGCASGSCRTTRAVAFDPNTLPPEEEPSR